MKCCCGESSPSEQLEKANADKAILVLTHFIKRAIKSNSDINREMLDWYLNDRKLALNNHYRISSDEAEKLITEIKVIESLLKTKWDTEFLAAQRLIGIMPHYGDKTK